MFGIRFSSLAFAGSLIAFTGSAQFADSVISYTPGAGIAAAYTDPSRALGAPAGFIGYQDADPFNPPYRPNELVGLGAGGSLTLKFNAPVQNSPGHPFGLDFLVFGHAGFVITNGDYAGGGVTDGSLFATGTGTTRISVSADGITFYTLNPSLTPALDGLFPTDSNGNYLVPVNPALHASDFAGKGLADIRALYAGSAGGAGVDLAWAQNGSGQSVLLDSVSFVRLDVLSGADYLDGLSVVPEPGSLALTGLGALLLWQGRRFSRRAARAGDRLPALAFTR